MADFPERKTTRLNGFDYNSAGAYFITICTKDRKCILSDVTDDGDSVGVPKKSYEPKTTGVLDGPNERIDRYAKQTGQTVLDGPNERFNLNENHVGQTVLDGPNVRLKPFGQIAEKYLLQINDHYDNLTVDKYVIMPNHIHIMLVVKPGKCETADDNKTGPSGTPVNSNGPSGTPVPTVNQLQNSTVSRFVSTFKRFCNREIGENIWQSRSYDHIVRDKDDYDTRVKYICENPMRWKYDEMFSIN